MTVTMFDGLMEVLRIRKPSNIERRLNETPREFSEGNFPSKRCVPNPKQPMSCRGIADIRLPYLFPDCVAILIVALGCGSLGIHWEGRVKDNSMSLMVKSVSRIFLTLGSDSYATRNGESSFGCALDGVAEVKKLKRAKLERLT